MRALQVEVPAGTGIVLQDEGFLRLWQRKRRAGRAGRLSNCRHSLKRAGNQWHHLVGMFTGTQLQIFLDSVRQETLGMAITPPANDRDVEIGRWWSAKTV